MPKNTPLIKDWLAFGFATGAALSAAKSVASRVIGRTGFKMMPFGKTATHLVLGNRTRPWWHFAAKKETSAEQATGPLVDILMGGAYGAGTSFIISLSPPGNEFAKGMMAGALASIGTIVVGRALGIKDLVTIDADEALGMILSGAAFGGAQGLILGRFGSGMVVQSHPVAVKEVTDRGFERGRLKLSAPQ